MLNTYDNGIVYVAYTYMDTTMTFTHHLPCSSETNATVCVASWQRMLRRHQAPQNMAFLVLEYQNMNEDKTLEVFV